MDIQMPALDGIETTKMIRLKEKERGINPAKIFALTASGDNYKEQSAAIEEVDFNEGFLEIFMSKVF